VVKVNVVNVVVLLHLRLHPVLLHLRLHLRLQPESAILLLLNVLLLGVK